MKVMEATERSTVDRGFHHLGQGYSTLTFRGPEPADFQFCLNQSLIVGEQYKKMQWNWHRGPELSLRPLKEGFSSRIKQKEFEPQDIKSCYLINNVSYQISDRHCVNQK